MVYSAATHIGMHIAQQRPAHHYKTTIVVITPSQYDFSLRDLSPVAALDYRGST